MWNRHIFITALLFFISEISFGQADFLKPSKKKWIIGTILMNESNSFRANSFNPNFLTGIVIKRNLKYFKPRIGIEYVNIQHKNSESKKINTIGYTSEGIIRLGIEKSFFIQKRVRPFAGMDLMAVKSYSNQTLEEGSIIYERIITNKNSFGVSPCLGLEYRFTNTISLSMETRVRFLYTKRIMNFQYILIEYPEDTFKDKFYDRTINRIGGVTLNIYF